VRIIFSGCCCCQLYTCDQRQRECRYGNALGISQSTHESLYDDEDLRHEHGMKQQAIAAPFCCAAIWSVMAESVTYCGAAIWSLSGEKPTWIARGLADGHPWRRVGRTAP
jgi:hypothetical protein